MHASNTYIFTITSSPSSNEMKRFLLQSIHLPVLSFCFLLKTLCSFDSASSAFITHCIVCLVVSVICDSAMWSALNEGKINKSCLLIYIFYYYSIIESKQCVPRGAECFGFVLLSLLLLLRNRAICQSSKWLEVWREAFW